MSLGKKEVRKEILARRNRLSEQERKEKSEWIAKRVTALEVFQSADVVLLYASMKSEVETDAILREARRQGKQIYYPRVIGDKMEFYLVVEATEMELSSYGIREPKPESTVAFEPREQDKIFVLMPGAVFDEAGNRIGYGGGYYDKYLQWLVGVTPSENICKAAVAYECQMVESGLIESEPHDVCVDYVITENRDCSNVKG